MTQAFFVSKVEECEIAPFIGPLIKECFGSSSPKVYTKKQFSYISSYLKKLHVETIVCETEYVDSDYLQDYSKYYVKCFGNYSRKCARLHFFSHEFGKKDFVSLLKGEDESLSLTESKLNEKYLGFIVVRPLPIAFIGRSCLRVYDNFEGIANKCRLEKEYKANLFGLSLTVQSIAFQEQDKVVSACATASLWSLFHAIHKDAIDHIPSPSEITLNALSMTSVNGFPNEGLQQAEIIKVLESNQIKHHGKRFDVDVPGDQRYLAASIKAHIDSKIPLLLGVSVYKNLEYKGEHLVTVLGYWGGKHSSSEAPIDGIYIHDDRIGPFVRAEIVSESTTKTPLLLKKKSDAVTPRFSIRFSKPDTAKGEENIADVLLPNVLIIGTYQKIRIPFECIALTCTQIGKSINNALKNEGAKLDKPHEGELLWDIMLCESSSLKKTYLADNKVESKLEVLTSHWPRFVWVGKFQYRGYRFDFLYDATDIPQGEAFVTVVKFLPNVAFRNIISPLMRRYGQEVHLDPENGDTFSFLFQTIRGLQINEKGFFSNLDELYGEPNLPTKFKDEETHDYEVVVQPHWQEFYIRSNKKLKGLFDEGNCDKLIWLISCYGVLTVGRDGEGEGHPTLSAGASARIAGEILSKEGQFEINHFSGRYSQWHSHAAKCTYLENVLLRFKEIFPDESIAIDERARVPR